MHISIFPNDVPNLLHELSLAPEMQRLAGVGMHCGCEYTDAPVYENERYPYSRLLHSIGVSRIVWNFTKDINQAVAGLLHDIATPVFAHTIDFMNNDHMLQESTEQQTLSFILESKQIMELLDLNGIRVEDICDYHIYPLADNDTPKLSADRLEYTIGNGHNIFGVELDQISEMFDDLIVVENEIGEKEMCFQTTKKAKAFSFMALRNSYFYVSDEDRYSMQYLAGIMQRAIKKEVLTLEDLHTTENEVIDKMSQDRELLAQWEEFSRISSVNISPGALCDRYCVNVDAKKRYIDPLTMTDKGIARASEIFPDLKRDISAFLALDFNYWLYVETSRYDSIRIRPE